MSTTLKHCRKPSCNNRRHPGILRAVIRLITTNARGMAQWWEHIWVEFVGPLSTLFPEMFSGNSGFPLSSKNQPTIWSISFPGSLFDWIFRKWPISAPLLNIVDTEIKFIIMRFLQIEYTIHRNNKGLGINIAGGKGSTPYTGNDEVCGISDREKWGNKVSLPSPFPFFSHSRSIVSYLQTPRYLRQNWKIILFQRVCF